MPSVGETFTVIGKNLAKRALLASFGGPIGAVIVLTWTAYDIVQVAQQVYHNDDASKSDKVRNPKENPEDFEEWKGPRMPNRPRPQRNINDGSMWEKDVAGDRAHGSGWKRWPDKRAWAKGAKPQTITPSGKIR